MARQYEFKIINEDEHTIHAYLHDDNTLEIIQLDDNDPLNHTKAAFDFINTTLRYVRDMKISKVKIDLVENN